jgi:hypothetical protein
MSGSLVTYMSTNISFSINSVLNILLIGCLGDDFFFNVPINKEKSMCHTFTCLNIARKKKTRDRMKF